MVYNLLTVIYLLKHKQYIDSTYMMIEWELDFCGVQKH